MAATTCGQQLTFDIYNAAGIHFTTEKKREKLSYQF